jgi:hypothetical protein
MQNKILTVLFNIQLSSHLVSNLLENHYKKILLYALYYIYLHLIFLRYFKYYSLILTKQSSNHPNMQTLIYKSNKKSRIKS